MDDLIAVLHRHVPRVRPATLAGLTATGPLAGCASIRDVLRRCRTGPRATRNRCLAAVLTAATYDPVLVEVALVALAPGLGRVRAGLSRCDDRSEVATRVVAEAWAALVEMVGEPGEWPATAVCDRARGRVRAGLRADARRRLREESLATVADYPAPLPVEDEEGVDPLEVLGAAVDSGVVSAADAALVWRTRVGGWSLAEVSRATGVRHDGLRRRRSLAERALRAAA